MIDKAKIKELPRIDDRITFLYLEHCRINREDGAITVKDSQGTAYIPAAMVSTLLLGPGSDITHRAIELIGDAGVSIIWVGEHGVRYYACGRALTNHSTLLLKQAEYVSNEKKHISVARKMYQLRFPNEDVSKLTMQQLRGREGSRVRGIYRRLSKEKGVKWSGREYKPGGQDASDPVNQSLSVGNSCLYGLAHAVICALGLSPGLGFVHVGHQESFVYDLADLYKAETTIVVAFDVASENVDNIERETRRRLRDVFRTGHIINRMVRDIHFLFSEDEKPEDYSSTLYLWDDKEGNLDHGVLYSCEGELEV